MNSLSAQADLKEISAYKKKLTWGDVPAIFNMAFSSVSELDGTLTHGFDNAYKLLLDRNHWNLQLLQGFHDKLGNIQVKSKPKILLKHIYDEHHYELHCLPIVNGEALHTGSINNPQCPFINWVPESMQMLFRVNNIISFILYAFRGGDQADLALIKYAHLKVEQLIQILSESFDIVDIKGYSLAEFCREIAHRKNLHDTSD